ncbi:Nuclear protein X1 isoform 3 [Cucumis melo var. makuwa]|uniref:Nuclear protein X1 isoform 3 n=1 Tax=Cucumis melo var. makuwa TaxID=1194695 RepID=A0A5A7TXH4_CUCMM|nr:Nuclear protein X1 isoform 3 [Cucumis melo var. makuwa]
MSGKHLPTQSSTWGQTSGEVSRDRLSRRCVGHASRKPLSTLCWSCVGKASVDVVFPDANNDVGKASPDRLYRAALLRNQFADTILKAREKHLKMFLQGDKRDPEKVRMEREELERWKREGWRRATDGGRLKLKLQSRRRTTTKMEGTTASYGQRQFLSSPNPFPFVFNSV